MIISIHFARAFEYAPLEFTVEFNSSERSMLNLLKLPSVSKSQFCRQSNPSGHVVIGEDISPSIQVDSTEVGLSVLGVGLVGLDDGYEVGSDVVGRDNGIEVGVDVVGWDDGNVVGSGVVGWGHGPDVVGCDDGPAVAGSEEVGLSVVGVDGVG